MKKMVALFWDAVRRARVLLRRLRGLELSDCDCARPGL